MESLSDELTRWLDRKAEELGTSRAEVVSRAVTAYRLVDENHESLADAAASDEDGSRRDELTGRLDELEAEFDEKLTDVRERVVQVKREADEKAPVGHDHPETSARVDEIDAELTALDERIEAGFGNYEEILDYLTETTDDAEAKLDTLATAVVDLRRRADELERSNAESAAATELKREANRTGIEKASCENCEASVSVCLLDGPYCPHCTSTFDGVRPKRGLFGTATLTVGNRPKLEGPDTEEAPEGLFEEGA
ncbi:coiled-coil domain-containing protein [Halopelagius inordinatus]|uniref:CopG family transcriptional regulator n=1 Tax=Halopelagius inordinatus TaxID=553467 RepID=UPI001160400A|nr:CopG family transcriptional regulator [Halopelagius inordinatus]